MTSGNKTVLVSEVYTFAMTKHVYLQFTGIEKPARIDADKVEEDHNGKTVIVKKGETTVGKFKGETIAGWWIEDE